MPPSSKRLGAAAVSIVAAASLAGAGSAGADECISCVEPSPEGYPPGISTAFIKAPDAASAAFIKIDEAFIKGSAGEDIDGDPFGKAPDDSFHKAP